MEFPSSNEDVIQLHGKGLFIFHVKETNKAVTTSPCILLCRNKPLIYITKGLKVSYIFFAFRLSAKDEKKKEDILLFCKKFSFLLLSLLSHCALASRLLLNTRFH